MIFEFNYYLDKNLARKASPDKGEAESLMNKAEGRLRYAIKIREITGRTAPYIFEDIYECLQEAAQSLMSLKGYKSYSPEALLPFLKEYFTFPESDMAAFDRYRNLRNKAVDRGEKISVETCHEALKFLLYLLPKLKHQYKKLLEK